MPDISAAADILRRGGLVAFPTETVYGLGADATNAAAVRRIFEVKGRPATNPVIVHVADEAVARRYAAEWPGAAEELARRFWPGPLTVVVPKSPEIVPEVTAGRGTVGLRSPDHPLALELLRRFDGPVAAPSANRSTRISPTSAGHVRAELGDAVDLILDGGPCRVGIESTVLDLSGGKPVILRPGGVSREQIEAVIGRVELFRGVVASGTAAASPGQAAVHYAPAAAAFRFEAREAARAAGWMREHAQIRAAVLSFEDPGASVEVQHAISSQHLLFSMPPDPAEYARVLYSTLREADRPPVEAILVQMPPDEPRWAAVRDRLTRATRPLPSPLQP